MKQLQVQPQHSPAAVPRSFCSAACPDSVACHVHRAGTCDWLQRGVLGLNDQPFLLSKTVIIGGQPPS